MADRGDRDVRGVRRRLRSLENTGVDQGRRFLCGLLRSAGTSFVGAVHADGAP